MNPCNLIVLGTILLHIERTVNKSVMKANEFNRFRIVFFLSYFVFVGEQVLVCALVLHLTGVHNIILRPLSSVSLG